MTEFETKMAELRQRFMDRAPARLEDLKAALAHQDSEAVVGLAHRLAGNAGMFGFPALSEAAAELEDAARDNEAGVIAPRGERVVAMLTRIAEGEAP